MANRELTDYETYQKQNQLSTPKNSTLNDDTVERTTKDGRRVRREIVREPNMFIPDNNSNPDSLRPVDPDKLPPTPEVVFTQGTFARLTPEERLERESRRTGGKPRQETVYDARRRAIAIQNRKKQERSSD